MTQADRIDWLAYLRICRPGDVWAVWADGERMVQMCRKDGPDLWATPVGHMTEGEMRRRGWIKADGTEPA